MNIWSYCQHRCQRGAERSRGGGASALKYLRVLRELDPGTANVPGEVALAVDAVAARDGVEKETVFSVDEPPALGAADEHEGPPEVLGRVPETCHGRQ